MTMQALRAFRPITWMVLVTLLALVALPRTASAQAGGAQLTVNGSGTVRVDGAVAATGATIFPGQRVTTAPGVSAVVTSGGSRVTLNPETDAVITHAGGWMRADVLCGSASGVPAPGSTFEMITHGDTSVFVQTGTTQVVSDGKTVQLVANQTETFLGGVRITTAGGSSMEASTLLCSCLCAAPVAFPAPVAAFPLLLLLLLAGAAAAATTTTVILTGDEGTVVISDPNP
jgi:hypothetical protein